MPSSKLVYFAEFKMGEVSDEEIEAIIAGVVEAAEEEEPGTLVYAWYRHVDDPSRWTVVEVYEDEAAQQLHLKGPKMLRATKRLADLIDFASGTGTKMTAIGGKGVS
jgi:quinol monooxygenase YgiN